MRAALATLPIFLSVGTLVFGFCVLIFGVFLKGKVEVPEEDASRRSRKLKLPMKKWQRT